MAVYTDVSAEDLADFLPTTISASCCPTRASPRASRTPTSWSTPARGHYILTLYEKRVAAGDLPFFLALMEHLAARGLTCPQPVKNRTGDALGSCAGRPAAIVTFLDGMWIRRPGAGHCAAVGEALAQLHLAGARLFRASGATRSRSRAGARSSRRPRRAPTSVQPGLRDAIEAELACSKRHGRAGLPQGVIHADLFPDNVFFLGDQLSGLIDFYFACTDTLAYDVAICLNAWCFEPDHAYNVTKGRALLQLYVATRPLSDAERAALPLLARGAALRFLLTRLVDWLNVPPGALVRPKDPLEYFRKLRFHQAVGSVRDYGIGRRAARVTRGPHVIVYTDGACSGNPGPGGWGAILPLGEHEKELKGGEAAHHQQPHGADGGDLGARGAEAALHGRSAHRQPVCARRHHEMDQRLEAQRLAHRRQEAGEERGPVAAARRRARRARRALALGEGPRRP